VSVVAGERKSARPGQSKVDASRTERLAAELRENLKRRKARERALNAQHAGRDDSTSAEDDDSNRKPR
jgi:hypothetical protein